MPLHNHRRWAGDHNKIDPTTEQHLSEHEPGFDCLAQTYIVGNQYVDPRQVQCLLQRGELIGVKPNSRTKWCLKEGFVRN